MLNNRRVLKNQRWFLVLWRISPPMSNQWLEILHEWWPKRGSLSEQQESRVSGRFSGGPVTPLSLNQSLFLMAMPKTWNIFIFHGTFPSCFLFSGSNFPTFSSLETIYTPIEVGEHQQHFGTLRLRRRKSPRWARSERPLDSNVTGVNLSHFHQKFLVENIRGLATRFQLLKDESLEE